MESISKEEHLKITDKTPFLTKVRALQIGEAISITDKEWPHKSEVPVYVRSLDFGSGRKYSIKRLADNSGYSILRKE